jgi:uncharacterized protein (TIGR03067 family)
MPTDLDRIQGAWHITSLESDGVKAPGVTFQQAGVVVKGKAFTATGMGAAYKGTIELKSTTKPKSVDFAYTAGPEKGNRNLGIYTLEKDRWVICLATRGARRPTRFATKAGTGLALETLERGAPPKPPKPPKKTPDKKAAKTADKKAVEPVTAPTPIEGEWAMISGVFDGKPMAENMVAWCKRITHGDVTTVMAGPQTMLKARFTLNPATRPGGIDYVNLEGTHKGKPQAGIYDLSHGILRICMSAPGQSRPDVFVSKAGDGRSFTTWRLA